MFNLRFILSVSILLVATGFLSCGLPQSDKIPEQILERKPVEQGKIETSEQKEEKKEVKEEKKRTPSSERRRLRVDKENIIESILNSRYSGTKSYDSYGGPLCKEYQDCRDICDEFRSVKSRCYKQPESLVLDLKDGLFHLLHISSVESVDVSPGLLLGILKIDDDLIIELIEEHMSEGSVKSFLAWVAINEDIAGVLEKEDSRGKILETAFETLGKFQKADEEFKSGINTGLLGIDDTFLFLAADEDNEKAFVIAHELIEKAGKGVDEKKDIYCARHKQSRSRSLSRFQDVRTCRTPDSKRRSYRARYCYVHGGDAWSYLYELVDDEEIKDKDFEDEDALGVEKCNSHCKSRKCDAVD